MKLTLSHLSKTFGDVCALQDVSIEMEAGIYGILGPNGAGKSTLMKLLDLLNLSDVANRTLRTFSGGMKRRAILAQALLGDPKILILDEPTAGLDPKERITLRNLIAELSGDRIVILATHIVSDIECIANRVVLLRQGRLLANDSPGHLIGTISGKVGKKQISRAQIAAMQKQKNIGNIVQSKDGFMVHVISDTLPSDVEKITSEITLEDVFLYYFEAEQTHEP